MSDNQLRTQLIKLAYENPGEVQDAVLPLLKQAAKAEKPRLPKYGELHRESLAGGKATLVVRGVFQSRKGDSYHVRVLKGEGKQSDERKKGSVLWKDDFYIESYKLKDAIKAGKAWSKKGLKKVGSTSPADWPEIFDSLRPGQVVQIAMTATSGRSELYDGKHHAWIVGRKSRSKSVGYEVLKLSPVETDNSAPANISVHKLLKWMRMGSKQRVEIVVGNMSLNLLSIRT